MTDTVAAPWLFVHVPKTAGTSFRQSAVQALGAEHCEFDYGPVSPSTTQRVRELTYDAQDLFRLRQRMRKDGVTMLAGHVPLQRYASLFPSARIVSFVRDPLAQLLSHHAHLSRTSDVLPLAEFVAGPQGAGLQSRLLSGPPLAALGPIGITERFEDSLRVINAALGVNLKPAQLNLNPQRQEVTESLYELPPELSSSLQVLLREDQALYARAGQLLDERLALLDAGLPFANGALTEVTPPLVRGFAFWPAQTRVVSLQLQVNGAAVADLKATRFHARWRALNTPREGCVGFEYRPAEPLRAGDVVQARVVETGQVLGTHRLT
ncbi:hypothetical protein [Ideonella sp.]|uniref:hypothetical protein n=1 Tax=Ideonella sp. TaxID=1929293 RepID=UPI003BB76A2B